MPVNGPCLWEGPEETTALRLQESADMGGQRISELGERHYGTLSERLDQEGQLGINREEEEEDYTGDSLEVPSLTAAW